MYMLKEYIDVNISRSLKQYYFIIKNFIITINMQLQRKEISKKRENSLTGTILIKFLYVLHLNLYDQ